MQCTQMGPPYFRVPNNGSLPRELWVNGSMVMLICDHELPRDPKTWRAIHRELGTLRLDCFQMRLKITSLKSYIIIIGTYYQTS